MLENGRFHVGPRNPLPAFARQCAPLLRLLSTGCVYSPVSLGAPPRKYLHLRRPQNYRLVSEISEIGEAETALRPDRVSNRHATPCNLPAAARRWQHHTMDADMFTPRWTIVLRMTVATVTVAAVLLASPLRAHAQSAENVAVVINDNSADSQKIGLAYARARSIPDSNVLHIRTSTEETVDRDTFVRTIEGPLAAAISRERLQDRILYLVLAKGVPLRVAGTLGQAGTVASVDSELTLLYRRMTGQVVAPGGPVANPYFLADRDIADARPFTHHAFDIFLVSRLDAYTVDQALALIEKAASEKGGGRIVLDQRDALVNRTAETWLELASKRLADQGYGGQVLLEASPRPARDVTQVIGYFSWGSTDPQNRVRTYGMSFAPGAIAAHFVGSDARTFREPPLGWIPTGDPVNRSSWYAGSPESLIGDLIRDGVTGVAGYVAQPFLNGTIRPQILFPAYVAGLNLVEAFYLAMPHLSWQTVVVGDPLCAPFPRKTLSRSDIEEGFDSVTELPTLFSKRRLAGAMKQSPGIPERAVALSVRASMLSSRGDTRGAGQAIDEAVELAPRFVTGLLQSAGLDELAGRRDEAIDTYKRILDIDPNNVIALNNLAYGLAVYQNMLKEALALAERAVIRAPTDPTILDTLAWVQHLLGDDASAAKVMEQVVRTNIPNPDIRLHAAIVFAAVGARALAQNELAVALTLNPALANSTEVKELQAQLAK